FILRFYLPSWIVCTCFELGISIERGFKKLNSMKTILFHIICNIQYIFQTNLIVLQFAKRRNESASNKQLNERYQ
ncbi:hypothetical protein PFISCL1PPCAC_28470, partial [Pristionchus fissidentatus]